MPPLRLFLWLLALPASALPVAPLVAGKPSIALASQTFVERVQTDGNGRSRRILAAARDISPGDQLIVILRYRNDSTKPVKGLAVTNAVPPAVRIDPASAAMQVSVDHGRTWGRLDTLVVPTGLGGTRRATADDVTHVRWAMPNPIRPGDEGKISYRATVR